MLWESSYKNGGPLLLEGTQVGTVIYRIDGGQWHEVTGASITAGSGTHNVQAAYDAGPAPTTTTPAR